MIFQSEGFEYRARTHTHTQAHGKIRYQIKTIKERAESYEHELCKTFERLSTL